MIQSEIPQATYLKQNITRTNASQGPASITLKTVNEKTILCKTNAIGAIANLATSPENKITIVQQNGLTPLIEAIESAGTNVFQEIDVQKSLNSMSQHSCRALFALSASDKNKILIERQGGLRPLISSLTARSWHIQWHAAGAVANLAIEKQNKLISQQNSLLSYISGLSVGVGSTDNVLLKRLKNIGGNSPK